MAWGTHKLTDRKHADKLLRDKHFVKRFEDL